jgi:RecB family exonuclease
VTAPAETAPTETAPAAGAPVDLGLPVVGSLSPSRAGDFMTCPLLFRFRTIDRLPSPPSSAATRGTLVHAVLERLFDLPAGERTPDAAGLLLQPEWERLVEAEPEVSGLFADESELAAWLSSARALLDGYFALEDPRRYEPAERESYVEVVLDGGLRLRGIVDRLDVAPDGRVKVVDYKGLALETPLPTPSGWTTMADVEVGDRLLAADGTPCNVVAKSSVHHRPCYEVRLSDGSSVVCDNVHLWTVHEPLGDGGGYQVRTVDTDDLHSLVSTRPTGAYGRRRLFIRAASSLELPEADLPINPWVLGAWLGDGRAKNGEITVGVADLQDTLTLMKEHWAGRAVVQPCTAGLAAVQVSLLRPEPRLCPYGHDDFRVASTARHEYRRCRREREHSAGQHRWNASLSELLSRAGLSRNKHVPAAYMRASAGQRLLLLQGLMDTDGSWNELRHRAVFVTTTPALAVAVRELVLSLGGTPTFFHKPAAPGSRHKGVFMVEFRPLGFNPFLLPRKAAPVDAWQASARQQRQGVPRELRRTIVSVTPVASTPTQCVMVDSADHLYLCGTTLIPTHNTGRSPHEAYEAKVLFQMKFYALVLWRTRGQIPSLLQLMYLGDTQVLRYVPDESDLLATERKLLALWEAIERATQARDFKPRRSKLCDWCDHQALCPEFGGTPPPWPQDAVSRLAASTSAAIPVQEPAD